MGHGTIKHSKAWGRGGDRGVHILHEHPAAMMLFDSALAGRREFLRCDQDWAFLRRGQSASKPCGGIEAHGSCAPSLACCMCNARSHAVAYTCVLLPQRLGGLKKCFRKRYLLHVRYIQGFGPNRRSRFRLITELARSAINTRYVCFTSFSE
jgi:hypothetical protein